MLAMLSAPMITLESIQTAFVALGPVPARASCYLVNQDDYDALEAATTQAFPAGALERGRVTSLWPSLDGVRLIPSRHVPRGKVIP